MVLGAFVELRKAAISFVMPLCPPVGSSECNTSTPTGRIFMKFWCMSIFRKSMENIHFLLKPYKKNGYLSRRRVYICDSTSLSSSENEKRFIQRLYVKSKHTFYLQYSPLPSPSRKSGRPSLWEKVEKYGRTGQATGDGIIRRMRFAWWIIKATDPTQNM
jgi:hypothetical protein